MRGGALGLVGLAALVFGLAPFAAKAEDHEVATSEATSSAVTRLALVDDGQYDASWDAASVLLRNSLTKVQFVQKVAAARQPLGKVLSRVLKMARTMTSLPSEWRISCPQI